MYQRIFVAVDGSATSRQAFNAALMLAQVMHSTLQPYYAIENPVIYFDVPGYDPSLLQTQLIAQGNALAEEFNAAMREKGVAGEVLMSEDTPVGSDVPSLLLNAAKAFNADLIVMGTHGRRGMQRLILGSVAERCVRQSTLPVLLIPTAATAT